MSHSQFIDGRDLRIAGLEAQNEALAARVVALEEVLGKASAFIAQAIEQGDVIGAALDDFDKLAADLARAKLEERG